LAILDMNRISVFGLHRDRKAVLEELHKSEAVEVCEPDGECGEFFGFRDPAEIEKSVAQFDKFMQAASAALAVLDEYAPVKSGFFTNRRVLPLKKYHMANAESDITLRAARQITGLSEKIRERRESIRQITAKQTALEPYLALDIPMNTGGTGYTFFKIGALGGEWTAEQIEKKLLEHELGSAYFEILRGSKEYTYVWFVFPRNQAKRAEEFRQSAGFSEPSFSLSHHTPRKKTEVLASAKNELEQEIQKYAAEIVAYGESRHVIELFYDHMNLRKDKYQALAKMGMTEHVFCVEGYIPKKYADGVRRRLEGKWNVHVELTEPEATEDVPVAFQNGGFAAPVESITETYSMPSPTDVDPNPFMAFFYYLFFGMMFSDAGYGLLLAVVCGYLGFGKRLEKSRRRSFKMFFYCGLSTMFWGAMYGSFFGNMIDTVSGTFFGKQITIQPPWLDPISQAMKLLVYSVAFGMVQILVGLGLKFYTLYRQKKILDAFCDAGLWIAALVGIGLLAAGIGVKIPALATVGKWTALVAGAGLVVTGGRKSKNIFGKIFGGITGLYGITGYMSDALSYCRLMALGLATGSISNVVNMLGAMFGRSVPGVLLFIVIAVFGHSLNFAMNILGAYVHTNRLQYVEFFSKFYEGGGRKFEPFRMNTKYCRFADETDK